MKTIRIHAHGDAHALRLEDAPLPDCAPSDLPVRVVAAGVNPIDGKIRSGAMAAVAPHALPFAWGWAASGSVTAVGSAVDGLKPGDEGFFYANFASGGNSAEFVAVDAAPVTLKPRTKNLATASALPISPEPQRAAARAKMVLHVAAPPAR